MLTLTAMTAERPAASPVMSAVYAAVATAIVAFATGLLFQAEILFLYILAFLLIGAAPVVGYQLATGQLGQDWKPLIGGFLSFILLILGWLLWPILVGAMTKGQSIWKLLMASVVGFIVGLVIFLIAGSIAGQDPAWVIFGFTLWCAAWGATVGWAMVAWSEPV